ncbi:hypothetical protein AB0F91_18845 [Amycolatopsis sp. NPDC023774]|uniref:hypothetical protein n=1 Tax=Amycolatopsis sp. NPDC023774 TaxID=3155015 RepID=UPI0033F897CF
MPKWALFERMRFTRQVLLLQIGVVVLVVGLGVFLVSWQLRSTLTEQYGERALAVASRWRRTPWWWMVRRRDGRAGNWRRVRLRCRGSMARCSW